MVNRDISIKDMNTDIKLIEELIRESKGCLPQGTIYLLSGYLRLILENKSVPEDFMVILPDGKIMLIPTSQLPEAWLNILHVYCYKDYVLDHEFLPKPYWTVLDLGAYIGTYTLFSSSLMGLKGTIVSIEPNPYALKYLKRNLRINELEFMVKILPYAISNYDGEGTLYITEYWAVSSIKKDYPLRFRYRVKELPVRVMKLSTLLNSLELRNIDLMKIDVEGAESEIIEELQRIIHRIHIGRIVVEVHRGLSDAMILTSTLRRLGYDVFLRDLGLKHQYFIFAVRI